MRLICPKISPAFLSARPFSGPYPRFAMSPSTSASAFQVIHVGPSPMRLKLPVTVRVLLAPFPFVTSRAPSRGSLSSTTNSRLNGPSTCPPCSVTLAWTCVRSRTRASIFPGMYSTSQFGSVSCLNTTSLLALNFVAPSRCRSIDVVAVTRLRRRHRRRSRIRQLGCRT